MKYDYLILLSANYKPKKKLALVLQIYLTLRLWTCLNRKVAFKSIKMDKQFISCDKKKRLLKNSYGANYSLIRQIRDFLRFFKCSFRLIWDLVFYISIYKTNWHLIHLLSDM